MRLVAMDHISFQEKWRIKITPFQLTSLIILALLTFFFITYLLFAHTFFGLLLPDNVLDKSRNEIIETHATAEKLEKKIAQQEAFINNLQKVILGEVDVDSIYHHEGSLNPLKQEIDTTRTQEELFLETQIDQREQELLQHNPTTQKDLFLIDPVSGKISQAFNKKNHPAVDIVTQEGESVLACYEGVVVYSGYDDLDGWIVILKHPNEILSVYKHCGKILKEAGDIVRSGDPIAIVGNTGERTTGPHLHFELWSARGPLDPTDYLSFRR